MVRTPVLFETYIRVDTAREVWESIKKAKPCKLYFYSNKAPAERPDDIKKNEEIRSWVKEVNWPCEVHTFFRDEQVDQYTSLIGSKQWLFENEETGIILEDDCVPSMAFFEYCDHYLKKYENEKKISFISGNNYSRGFNACSNCSHLLTSSQLHFGWCTWRDRFASINFDLLPSEVENNNGFTKYYDNLYIRWFYRLFFFRIEDFIKKTRCWDYVWTLNCINEQKYVVSPLTNLVKNIGLYGEHANGDKLLYEVEIGFDDHYNFGDDDKCDFLNKNRYDYYELAFFKRTSFKSKIRLLLDVIKYKLNKRK